MQPLEQLKQKFRVYQSKEIEIYSPNLLKPGGMWFLFYHKPSNEMVLIDCGIGFSPELQFDSNVRFYDKEATEQMGFIKVLTEGQKLHVLISHGHLDHTVGLLGLAEDTELEIYASWFSAECINRLFWRERQELNFPVNVLREPVGEIKLGNFQIKYFRTSHSMPETYSYLIETSNNRTIFLAEARLPDLPFEKGTTKRALKFLEQNGPFDSVLFDGLFRSKPGFSVSEEAIRLPMHKLLHHEKIRASKGNVLLPYISSKLGITMIIMEETYNAGWALLTYGRMMVDMTDIGQAAGWLPEKQFPEGYDYQIVKNITGSQAEVNSALYRAVYEEDTKNLRLSLNPNDWIVIFQGVIPDNTEKFKKMLIAAAQKLRSGGIIIPRKELKRLGIGHLSNVYEMEKFLGIKKDIILPSGHERRDGQNVILAATKTPLEKCIPYQFLRPEEKTSKDQRRLAKAQDIPAGSDEFEKVRQQVIAELTSKLKV